MCQKLTHTLKIQWEIVVNIDLFEVILPLFSLSNNVLDPMDDCGFV